MGVSNPWTEIWNGTVELKMEWSTYNYSYVTPVTVAVIHGVLAMSRVLISPQRLYEQVSVASILPCLL